MTNLYGWKAPRAFRDIQADFVLYYTIGYLPQADPSPSEPAAPAAPATPATLAPSTPTAEAAPRPPTIRARFGLRLLAVASRRR